MIITLVVCIYLAFMYRFRGGGFIQTGSDTLCRLSWGAALAVSVFFIGLPSFECVLWTFLAGFLAVSVVPHAFCMNMGRGTMPWNLQDGGKLKKYWPGIWLPSFTQAEYTTLPFWIKSLLDTLGMASVGSVRGLTVFGGIGAVDCFMGASVAETALHVIQAVGVLTILSPVVYQMGWVFPLNFPSLGKDGTEWGEWFQGMVWGLAIAAYYA